MRLLMALCWAATPALAAPPSCPPDCDRDRWDWPADCNDGDPDVNPDASEVCNGFDDDCNGLIDDLPECAWVCDDPAGDGSPPLVAPPAPFAMRSVWNGDGFGLFTVPTADQVELRLLDGDGALVDGPIVVVPATLPTSDLDVAWTGSGYGLLRRGLLEEGYLDHGLLFRYVDAAGQDVTGDSFVSITGGAQNPALAWSGSEFGAVWQAGEIRFRRIGIDGTLLGAQNTLVSGDPTTSSWNPVVAGNGSSYGVAWIDYRNATREAYFRLLDDTGAPLGDEIRVAPGTTAVAPLSLVWVGDAFALLWESSSTFYLTRISPAGSVEAGPEAILTLPTGSAEGPRLAWSGQELALSWLMDDYDPFGGGELTSNLGLARFTPQGQMLGSLIPLAPRDQEFSDTGALVWDGAHYTAFPVRSPGGVVGIRVICGCGDGDGDGFIGCHECDDADGTVYPGAPQICDGLNNDCLHASWPGLEGTTEFDNDGDGPSACAGDCDDANAFTYPGAAPLDDPLACHRDVDGDDYGAMSPPGGVTPGSDCNDTEAPLRTSPAEVPWLQVRSLDAVTTEITWQPVTDWGGGPEGTYWLLRSTDPADFVSNSVSACAVHVFEGTTATHLVVLQPVNSVYAYLVLAANHCVPPLNNGTVGSDSHGTPRPARVCP